MAMLVFVFNALIHSYFIIAARSGVLLVKTLKCGSTGTTISRERGHKLTLLAKKVYIASAFLCLCYYSSKL